MNLQAEVDFYSSLACIKKIFLSPADSCANGGVGAALAHRFKNVARLLIVADLATIKHNYN